MVDEDQSLAAISVDKHEESNKGKLESPDPIRKKFMAELLNEFGNRKITFSDLVGLDKKKIRQVAEIAYVKLRHGRYKEARKIFEILTFLDHKNFFFHLCLGSAYQKLSLSIDAIYQYSQVLKVKPKHLNALVNRGEIYLRMKNYRKAAEDFRDAIVIDKDGKDVFANRARSLVLAIKRSLAKDKAEKQKIKTTPPKNKINTSSKKMISPFEAMGIKENDSKEKK